MSKEQLTAWQASKELDTGASLALVIVVVLLGAIGWWLSLRMPEELDHSSIERISMNLADWSGEDIAISESVERMLRADSQVQRAYRTNNGELIWLYVGYYGTERGGRPEHTPWACYPAAGWLILSETEHALDAQGPNENDRGRLNEFVVEQGGNRRLVHFWYATHRSVAISRNTDLFFDHLAGRLSMAGRADGALVRISTPIDSEGITAARRRLRRFAIPLIREVRENWPLAEDARIAISSI